MAKTQIQNIALVLPAGPFFDRAFGELQALCGSLGVTCARPPVEFSADHRLGQSCAELERADLVVADISGRNPNTLYLAGYAHGIGKRLLFLTHHGEDIPLNPTKHDVIVYHANLDLLRQALKTFLRTGATDSGPGTQPPTAAADAKARFQTIFGDLMTAHGARHKGEILMENDKTFVLVEQDLDLAVVQALARRARELGLRIKLL